MTKALSVLMLLLLAVGLSASCACDESTGLDDDDDDPSDDDDTASDDDDDSAPPDDDAVDDDTGGYGYDVPVKSDAPWPMHRRTVSNSGRSPIRPVANDREPWVYSTGRGVYHEIAIDADGTLYVGTADTFIHAINPDGSEKWRFATGEINDSTALIGADGTIFAPSGDGYVYAINPDGTERWRLAALGGAFITWWEGHIAMGPDGTLYAGNDDRRMYAISQAGDVLWTHETGDQIWSCPALDFRGRLYFGSNDVMVRSITTEGDARWRALTLGPVAGSVSLNDARDTVYAGSFDGHLHAIDAASGKRLWKHPARDHLYASPSVGADGTIYAGSADGSMYAINPDGSARWTYDTLDPIRSSAAIDGDGNIYFGAGDGRVYALSPEGERLWAFDTSTSDRNDLNGSPSIGENGVYIGGEAGDIVFIPFGWCETSNDPRCVTSAGEDIPTDGALLYYYSTGGNSEPSVTETPAPTSAMTFRLVVREGGDTICARIKSETLHVTVAPNFAYRVEPSADGNFVSIIPDAPLPMDANYLVEISGEYLVGGFRLGNRVVGGNVGGNFERTFSFRTAAPTGNGLPLAIGANESTVLWLRRMAVPQPPMMTTFNQIGFDSYNFFVAPVAIDEESGALVTIAVEGTPGLNPAVNPDSKSIFALNGQSIDSYFALEGAGFAVSITDVDIRLDDFRASGRLYPDLTSDPLNIYGEVTCANVEFFGTQLDILGLCHPDSGKLIVNGTALFSPAPGDLGSRPDIDVDSIDAGADFVRANFTANDLPAADHLPIVVLLDDATGRAVELDYGLSLEKAAKPNGTLASVTLHLPDGFDLSGKTAVVLVNLYPVHEEQVSF
ncbi:PQQ-binding-like beta-propeller repeat protein [bacterium]|nr:PQQ-binding-like beta-propeller repeat protein [bacterium]